MNSVRIGKLIRVPTLEKQLILLMIRYCLMWLAFPQTGPRWSLTNHYLTVYHSLMVLCSLGKIRYKNPRDLPGSLMMKIVLRKMIPFWSSSFTAMRLQILLLFSLQILHKHTYLMISSILQQFLLFEIFSSIKAVNFLNLIIFMF